MGCDSPSFQSAVEAINRSATSFSTSVKTAGEIESAALASLGATASAHPARLDARSERRERRLDIFFFFLSLAELRQLRPRLLNPR